MANLIVGDIHGCYDELILLLDKAQFNPSCDILWLTGDLVARGPDSLAVLRYLKSIQHCVRIVLGNHDIHLLVVHAKIYKEKKHDQLTELLQAPDCDELIDWLRKQPLLQSDETLKLVMTHAGISPHWNLITAKQVAAEINQHLAGDAYIDFLQAAYGDFPDQWSLDLLGMDRWRYGINALTRMRYCYFDYRLDFECKVAPKFAPPQLLPWFAIPNPVIEQGYSITFGHWASLKAKHTPIHIYAMDTGCCWGKKLTLLRFEDQCYFKQKSLKR